MMNANVTTMTSQSTQRCAKTCHLTWDKCRGLGHSHSPRSVDSFRRTMVAGSSFGLNTPFSQQKFRFTDEPYPPSSAHTPIQPQITRQVKHKYPRVISLPKLFPPTPVRCIVRHLLCAFTCRALDGQWAKQRANWSKAGNVHLIEVFHCSTEVPPMAAVETIAPRALAHCGTRLKAQCPRPFGRQYPQRLPQPFMPPGTEEHRQERATPTAYG
jgi:hypothetical protein